jgi:hypothetical protein
MLLIDPTGRSLQKNVAFYQLFTRSLVRTFVESLKKASSIVAIEAQRLKILSRR